MITNAYKKLLVAFDGSESSKNALRQAILLGEQNQSWIKVLAVVPAYEGDLELVGVSNVGDVLKGPTEKLAKSAQEIADSMSAHIITDVEQGEAYEKIIDVADAENCDLIVMGRRGLRRLERMLMGSVTARVISHSDKNVLVVPRDAEIGWERIVVATDGSRCSEAAMARAIDYSRVFNSDLSIITVVDMYPEYYADAPQVVDKMEESAVKILETAKDEAKAAGVEAETQLLRGDPAVEISSWTEKNNVGLILVGSRGRSGLTKILMGSIAEKIIGLAHCPVMVAKPG